MLEFINSARSEKLAAIGRLKDKAANKLYELAGETYFQSAVSKGSKADKESELGKAYAEYYSLVLQSFCTSRN